MIKRVLLLLTVAALMAAMVAMVSMSSVSASAGIIAEPLKEGCKMTKGFAFAKNQGQCI